MSDPAGISTPSPDQKLAEAELTASGSYARSLGGGRTVTMAITPTALVIRGARRETTMPLDTIRLVRVGMYIDLSALGDRHAMWVGRRGDKRLARFLAGKDWAPLLDALCRAVIDSPHGGEVEAGSNRLALVVETAIQTAVVVALALVGVLLVLSRAWIGSILVFAVAGVFAWSARRDWIRRRPRLVQAMSELAPFIGPFPAEPSR